MKFKIGDIVQFNEFADPTGEIHSFSIKEYDDKKKKYLMTDGTIETWKSQEIIDKFCWLKK